MQVRLLATTDLRAISQVRYSRILSALFVGLLTLSATGCGHSPNGVDIKGTVTFDGKPLPNGTITVEPSGGKGAAATADIKDGAFSFGRIHDLKKGEYIARVQSFVPAAEQSPSAAATGVKTLDQIIPDKYNAQSELKMTLTDARTQEVTFAMTK
jgi:hypothetical protein